MSDLEKLSIYVPETMIATLDRDAMLFEIFKRDGRSINRNRFLSMVLLGFHDTYSKEVSNLIETVSRELESAEIDPFDREILSRNVAQAIASPIPPDQRGLNFRRLSLKPTRETEGLIQDILDTLGGENRSRYFYSMLTSYCSKTSNERERIVFKDNVTLLQEACTSGRLVSFNTPWNKKVIHRVIPYKLVVGQDKLLNYLLCYEETNLERKALAYRLSRINCPRLLGERKTIPETVATHLSQMERLSPQYAINNDEPACVRLTEKGAQTFLRIYNGRPPCKCIETMGRDYLYHFNCSHDQLFLYFRRFGPGEAEVLSPTALRNRLIDFHKGALDMYFEN